MIDTHAHIYLPEFDDDRAAVIQKAKDSGVETILLPAIDSSTHKAMLETESQFQNCYAMIGLHPCSVKEDFESELDVIKTHLEQRRFIAIGEIGLDFYWDKTFTLQQYEAFRKQIELSLHYALPIAIHSRNATDECIEVVQEFPSSKGVFHCFSGSADQARKIIDCGYYLGIGGVVSFKNAGLDKVILEIGLSHVVLETDAPYLAPVPYRGKRNEPAYTALVAQKLAEVTGLPLATVEEITTKNANKLFNLS